ncbi:VOC family protein [Corynebacterium sp. L4756]|uniref:VOC family protein n=1 Tax=unclassified Corynebacterium TaxID=2624378 RepID=UPI00374C94FD
MATSLRGIFLTSSDPAETAKFYHEVAQLQLTSVTAGDYTYWEYDDAGMQFAIHDADSFADYASPPQNGSNPMHLYFHIDDLMEFQMGLRDKGIEPIASDDVTITVVDPDGRKVLFGTV